MAACFTEFAWARNTVLGSRHPESTQPTYRGQSFGLHHAPTLWAEAHGRSVFVFAELDCQLMDLVAQTEAVKKVDEEFGLDTASVISYVDPAGLGTSPQTGKTDVEVLQENGIYVGNTDTTERFSGEQRTSIIKTLLRSQRLWISQECEYLIDALERAEWDRHPNGSLKDCYRKDGYWDHVLDALGEMLIRNGKAVVAAHQRPSGQVIARAMTDACSECGAPFITEVHQARVAFGSDPAEGFKVDSYALCRNGHKRWWHNGDAGGVGISSYPRLEVVFGRPEAHATFWREPGCENP